MKNKLFLLLISIITTLSACSGSSLSEKSVDKEEKVAAATQQLVMGNISPKSIQIDGPPDGADLYANVGIPLNIGAEIDWVADSFANSGSGCLTNDDIATCIEPNVTGAVGGVGHWNGLRLIDKVSSNDQDIFLSGGKENDTSTWNIGPGSVGSSKYDISQAYLANNQQNLYFGMERSGNNGTTAFDFEFNQLQPKALASCPQNPQIPCRSVGDVLFTFEMQGSGNNGSAIPHYYTWNGSMYVEGMASGILSSINNSLTTQNAPWGHVDSHGNWVLGNLDRFTFAEAVAPLSLLPGVNNCGGKAFVQVRTRSSATASSDLKDTTKVFQFTFNSISALGSLSPSCDGSLAFSASGVDSEGNPIVNPTCHWVFSNNMTADTCSGSIMVPAGEYTGTVTVSDPNTPTCTANAQTTSIKVYSPLAVHLSLVSPAPVCPMVSDSVTYNVIASGGNGNYSYTWSNASCSGNSCTIDPDDSTFCIDQTLSVSISDDSGLCPGVTSETETYTKVTIVTASDN